MFGELLRLAGQTLWANRLRSFLTVLGTAVAVLSIVAVVSVIRGADRFVATEVLSTGSDVFTLTKIGMVLDYESFLRARRRPDITLADAEDLERRLRLAEAVVPRESRRVTAKRGRIRAGDVPAWGVGADYPLVGDFEIASGRHLTHLDVVSRSPVAVLGAEIAAHLFPHEDPIGKTVRVGGRRYTVVGVLAARGGTADRSRDEVVLLPITTFEKHFGETSIDILVKARSSAERRPR
jgi:putative ABC transport system permease protein